MWVDSPECGNSMRSGDESTSGSKSAIISYMIYVPSVLFYLAAISKTYLVKKKILNNQSETDFAGILSGIFNITLQL